MNNILRIEQHFKGNGKSIQNDYENERKHEKILFIHYSVWAIYYSVSLIYFSVFSNSHEFNILSSIKIIKVLTEVVGFFYLFCSA